MLFLVWQITHYCISGVLILRRVAVGDELLAEDLQIGLILLRKGEIHQFEAAEYEYHFIPYLCDACNLSEVSLF